MASKKYLDLDGVSHLKDKLDATYQGKESGKGLSTNDYTTAEKTKLSGIASGAQVNVLEGVQLNGSTITPTNKIANIQITTTDNNYTTADKNKLTGIESGAEVNTIEAIEVNGVTATIDSNKKASVTISAGSIDTISVNGTNVPADVNKNVDITVPTNTNQLTNGAGFITGINSSDVTTALGYTPYNSTNPSGYQTASDVETAINNKISSTYKAAGSVAFASLPALLSANEGKVYNITDSFTTTSDFVEGAGSTYPAGTNVVIINTSGSTYKYDVLAGFVDLSAYQLSSELVAITNAEIDALFE